MIIELEHSFTIPVPPDQAWDVLFDVERVAPCMPGATVETVNGDNLAGRLKVKVGPVSLTYKGTARFTERDAAAHSVLVEASGQETRGAGGASATVRATLRPEQGGVERKNGQTLVTLHTTLNVTGRPAQFGRGMMAEIGGKLVEQFAENLAQQLTAGPFIPAGRDVSAPPGEPATAAPGTARASADATWPQAAQPGQARPEAQGAQPAQDAINLLSLAGPVVLKRIIPVVGITAAVALLVRRACRGFLQRVPARRC